MSWIDTANEIAAKTYESEGMHHSRKELADLIAPALEDEYERGKHHGDDDLKMSQAHCRQLQQELDRVRGEIGRFRYLLHAQHLAVDHVDGDAANNDLANLRLKVVEQNRGK